MNLIKLFIKALIFTPAKILSTFFIVYEKLVHITFPQLQSTMRNDLITVIDKDVREVIHQNKNKLVKFKIHTPNEICAVRHNTFSTKEPEFQKILQRTATMAAKRRLFLGRRLASSRTRRLHLRTYSCATRSWPHYLLLPLCTSRKWPRILSERCSSQW